MVPRAPPRRGPAAAGGFSPARERRAAGTTDAPYDPVGGKAVGVGVLYALVGTYQRVHRAQVPVVVTNGRFSRDAVKWGAEQNVLLVDRELLGRWASSGRPLWELLPRIPAPRNGHRT